jgi:hypothetical protein
VSGLFETQRAMPRDVREWNRFFQSANERLKVFGEQLILSTATTIAERSGTDLSTVLGYLSDAGRITEQRALPQVSAGNVLSLQNVNPLTATATALAATITIAAHSVQYGFGQVTYSGGSIAGLTPEADYYVYADDPDYQGGAVSYFATLTRQDVTANNGRYFVGAIRTAIAATTANITAATSANPIAFTASVAHGWASGDQVTFAGLPGDFGTNLNSTTHVITVTGATTFTIAINGSAYAAYTSGGTATRVSPATDGAAGGGGGWVDTFFFGGF